MDNGNGVDGGTGRKARRALELLLLGPADIPFSAALCLAAELENRLTGVVFASM
jgi:hypothetical protein